MLNAQSGRLLPTLAILEEDLQSLGFAVTAVIRDPERVYRGIRRYSGQNLRRDFLYVITSEEAAAVSGEGYTFVSGETLQFSENQLCCPGYAPELLTEVLSDLFLEFQETENRINSLVYGGNLDQLCRLGEELLDNAVCIHDSWFMILAKSPSANQVFPGGDGSWELIPQQFLDEFRLDEEYQSTYSHRRAELWQMEDSTGIHSSVYVNLYEKEIYRGRFLITDTHRPIRKRDYIIAELLARQAMVLLKARRSKTTTQNRSADDIFYDILNGNDTPAAEFSALMKALHWQKNDRFLCIRIRRQEPLRADPLEHILHRDLFTAFPASYIMFAGDQQCIIINLNKTPQSLAGIRHALAPLCRDYYQYGGISSPVAGIRELPVAYHQAEVALNQAFRLRGESWILFFHNCALDYTMMHLNTPMQLRHLAAPQLLELISYDREKGSQLFETFKTYLICERDIPKTAEKLIIHRTTLTYRLKKIQALMDLDLEDADVRLYLQLSLRMLEQENTVKLSETT